MVFLLCGNELPEEDFARYRQELVTFVLKTLLRVLKYNAFSMMKSWIL
jgi:hypothetical protein